MPPAEPHDVVVVGARLVVTMDGDRRLLPGGCVETRSGFVSALGGSDDPVPPAAAALAGADGLVTPGSVNTRHHRYQNLTRASAPAPGGDLFHWLRTRYPVQARLGDGRPEVAGLEDALRRHRAVAAEWLEAVR